jgi:uncharacterized protein
LVLRFTFHVSPRETDLMQTTLAVTALLMGLAGGPHCVAMCGAACAGIGRASSAPGSTQSTRSLWIFQAGRMVGYSALGGVAAASMQGLGWLSIHSAALRPIWTLFHVAAALLGVMLLWQARQPVWLENSARKVWRDVRTATNGISRGAAPLVIGVLWSLLPCGLLYSALLVAAMSGSTLEGAAVMALFAVGSGVSLMAGPWLWLRLRGRVPGSTGGKDGGGKWAIRIAGLALFATSGWALWMGLVHDTAPWCIAP